jgi:hypothetical protein
MTRQAKLLVRTGALLLLALCGLARAEVSDDMKSLIEQGRFADAFDLGMRHERLAGEPQYDYYFGVAAIDSGRATLGVLALERVLLGNPGNDLVRLELARGYFVIGDYERAREEFEYMQGRTLPTAVRNSVERYLAAIRAADSQFRIVRRTFFEYGVGHNSNVNSATSASTINIPSIGPITLGDGYKPSASALSQVAVGTQIQGPVSVDTKYYLGLEANHRVHAQRNAFDQGSLTALGGLDFDLGSSRLKTSAYVSRVLLDYARFRDTTGLVLDVSRPLSKETLVRGSLGYAQLRYGEANAGRDADLPSLSLGMNHYLGLPWKVALDVDVNLAEEQNIRGRGDFQRSVQGVRAGITFHPGGRWMGTAGGGLSWSNYKDADPLMQALRRDELLTLDASLQYQLTPGWAARGELALFRNQSSLALYSYDSALVMLKLRYEWK